MPERSDPCRARAKHGINKHMLRGSLGLAPANYRIPHIPPNRGMRSIRAQFQVCIALFFVYVLCFLNLTT